MIFNPNERNPIYPGSLRFCDIHNGVQFLIINVGGEFLKRGVFLSDPYEHIFDDKTKTFQADINVEKSDILNDGIIYLSDQGIVRYDCGLSAWNRYKFCISDTHNGIRDYSAWLNSGGIERLKQIKHSLSIIESGTNISKIKKAKSIIEGYFK